jgi:hypothetical protein
MLKWLKYGIIILISTVTGKTVVDFFGSYAVAGWTVRRIR